MSLVVPMLTIGLRDLSFKKPLEGNLTSSSWRSSDSAKRTLIMRNPGRGNVSQNAKLFFIIPSFVARESFAIHEKLIICML
jgi:hypothetical protein